MRPLFKQKNSLQIRLIYTTLLALILMLIDNKATYFTQLKVYCDTIFTPIYFIANAPYQTIVTVSKSLQSKKILEKENAILRQQLLNKTAKLQLLNQFQQENNLLRKLLYAPIRTDEFIGITEVISPYIPASNNQIIINKGKNAGIYSGQPLINEKGVVGQVISVTELTSRAILLCNLSHHLPVQILRNNVRAIAIGDDCQQGLRLEQISIHTDIKEGDVLVTSGLGGAFPAGYPVAEVVKITANHSDISVIAKPMVDMTQLRYLVLVKSPNEVDFDQSLSPEGVNQRAAERQLDIASYKENNYSALTNS